MSIPSYAEFISSVDLVLTTREAAHHLGVSTSTAQVWMESGALMSWKTPGGHRRCRLSEVLRLIRRATENDEPVPNIASEFRRPSAASYPMLETEQNRLLALSNSGLIGSSPDVMLDRLTWLATRVTDCPMAMVSLLTSKRQWFKSRVGLDVTETSREAAFCSHTIVELSGLVVEDARTDKRFATNPLVVGQPYIRFYAGVPVEDKHANRLGTLCVLDSRPRKLSANQHRGLAELAAIVTAEFCRR